METMLGVAGGIFLGLMGALLVVWLLLKSFVSSQRGAVRLLKLAGETFLSFAAWAVATLLGPWKK